MDTILRRYFDRKSYVHSIRLLRKLCKQCDYEIDKIKEEEEENVNMSLAFDGLAKFGEMIATIIFPNSVGSASKGGCAFDNHCLTTGIKREVKTCCLIQPKKCLTCSEINKQMLQDFLLCEQCEVIAKCSNCERKCKLKCENCNINKCNNCIQNFANIRPTKVPYFQKQCIYCECDIPENFEYVKDSRFGIDTNAHFIYKQILTTYLMNVIDFNNNNILISSYIINSNNLYFEKLLRNQFECGKANTCNILPYNHDFYASGPIKILDFIYSREKEIVSFTFNPNNKISQPYPIQKLKQTLKQTLKLDSNDDLLTLTEIPYDIIKNRLIPKTKTLGKERGQTKR